jgi:hypothetical protein
MITAKENKAGRADQMHSEHLHECAKCAHTVPVSMKRCIFCGADLMTMAECVPEEGQTDNGESKQELQAG